MKITFLLLAVLLSGTYSYAQTAQYLITDHGAKGDGVTLNSTFIQAAIDTCAARGGGKVIVPAGRFLTGTIALKSKVTLVLQKDAFIVGSTDVNDYQNLDPFTDGLGVDVGYALVVAVDLKDIAIEGEGAIDGQGKQLREKQIATDTRPEAQRWGRRPFLLRVVRCENVRVQDVKLLFAAAWTSHYFQCKRLHIEGVKITSHGVPHNDGMDIDGCSDVRITNCDIESGDDALCFKTTSSTMACRDIVVSKMRLKSGHGAIKMGTESMAPFENIRISDCYIYNTNNGGIKLLTVDGAHLRNIEISDITMVDVKTPILLRLGSRLSVFRKGRDVQQPTGTFEKVVIRNVKAEASANAQLKPPSGILITGVPGHYIKDVTLENISIRLAGGGTAVHARQEVPEAIDKYPEVKTFGPLVPAYGIWARHVKGLTLNNISFVLDSNDVRPAFICEDGEDITLTNWNIPATDGAESIIRLENVRSASIRRNKAGGKAAAFVRIEKTDGSNIRVEKNRIKGIGPARSVHQ